MHDIDRTQMEFAHGAHGFVSEHFEFAHPGAIGELTGVFSEEQEMELAQELLEVSTEAELDQFLGNLIKRAGSAIGSAIRSPVGQAIGGMLKGVAKKALPLAGTAIGTYFGGPLGAKIGGGLANLASNALGLEYESMEQEEREFEGARQFVRMAGDVVNQTACAPQQADPRAAAQAATLAAVKQHAPGLLAAAQTAGAGAGAAAGAALGSAGPAAAAGAGSAGTSGRWVKRGKTVILYGM